MHGAKWKKHIWKRVHTAWFPLYDTLEKIKLLRWKKNQWLLKVIGREGWIGRVQRIFRAVKLFGTVLKWWICISIYLLKFIEYTELRVNPYLICGLLVIMTSHYRFMAYNKWTTRVGDVGNGGGCTREYMGNLLLRFALNGKLPWRKFILNK